VTGVPVGLGHQGTMTPGEPPRIPAWAFWRRLQRKTREVGWRYTFQLMLETLIPDSIFAIDKKLITSQDPRIRSAHELTDAQMRIVSADDLASMTGAEAWPPLLRSTLEDGDEAAIFLRDGQVIAFRSFATRSYAASDWLQLVLPPDAVQIVVAWTAPELRGRGINAGTRNGLSRYLADKGVKSCIAYISALNRNSRRSFEKSGGYIGAYFYVRLFGLTLLHMNGTAKLGFWTHKRPLRLYVDPAAGRVDFSPTGATGSASEPGSAAG
jgi:hypothetical protein